MNSESVAAVLPAEIAKTGPATPRICAHFPSEIFSNLSKNPVNLSKFILFFGIVQG